MKQSISSTEMNAFALLGYAPSLEINARELQARFEHLRTQFHPDRFSQGSALERRLAVQRAADINAAHALLADPLKRAQHFYALRGLSMDEAQTMQDAEFLMQQMELREALDNAHDQAARAALRQQVEQLWQQNWQSLLPSEHAEDAASLLRSLQRLQFLQRFLQQME